MLSDVNLDVSVNVNVNVIHPIISQSNQSLAALALVWWIWLALLKQNR